MSIDVKIKDGKGSGSQACVTSRGQLVVAPLSFSTAYAVSATVVNTAYNFIEPVSGKQFVITDILLYANKGVGVADATVVLYAADSATTLTETKIILSIEMLKNSSRDITGLNLIMVEGRWLNIKTDDNTIFATVMGYYVNAE